MKQKQNFIDKYYLHSFFLGIILFLFYVLAINSSFLYTSIFNYSNLKSDDFDWATNPVKYSLNYLTVKQLDRNKKFVDLDSSLFVKIPNYNPDILARDISWLKAWNKDYEETLFYRTIYLTPYMWNYNHDWKENVWSHLAVDIKAPIWTPVYSIANWIITKVWFEKWWFWNYITIRHDNVKLSDWSVETIYSNYAHLDSVTIKEGEKISRWDPIWTVWETGLAVWSHLHFQIDLVWAPFHPYWPFSWADQRARGLDFFSAITTWLGKENAMKYTINPMTFINSNFNESTTVLDTNNDENIVSENTSNANIVKEETKVALNDSIETLKSDEVKERTTEEIKTVIESDLKLEDTATISKMELDSNIDIIKDPYLAYLSPQTISNNWIFLDVDESNKYYESIKYYKDKDLISGFSDAKFYPENDITRLESLKILLNSYSYSIIKWENTKFLDIANDFWWNWYIARAININLLSLENENFYPNRTINRVEVLKLITKLSDIDLSTYASKNYEIKDVTKTDWEYPYVVFAIDNNLFSLNNWYFYWSKWVSRWELVNLMYKFKK